MSTRIDPAGAVLAGRYRLVQPLAAGSSGRAWLADDLRLRRRVALKLLHEGLASDPGFLTRFREEAQTVASLHHPNIVTLHDWGEEPVPFMVLELLTGGSLAALVRSGRRLTPAQAARVGLQVAAALEHAHGRGLVHRDIKPANLLFDEHGGVRVADFGLARALAESGHTEPVEGLVGTARYAAPEQASDGRLDGRSDLYSLALVLVEAVTGSVPLVGESPLATLAARSQHPVQAPVELGALGVVVERAGMPDAIERYPDAASMRRGLESAAAMLPEPEPLPLAGLGVDLDDADPTELRHQAPAVVTATMPALGPPPAPLAPPLEPSPRPARRRAHRPRRLVPWLIGALALVALVTAGWAVGVASKPMVRVPGLVGHSHDDASTTATREGLHVVVGRRAYSSDPTGTVIGQQPLPGRQLRKGGTISLVLSLGPPPVDLPAVVGQDEGRAVAALKAARFAVTVRRQYHETVPAGRVVAEQPSTRQAPQGSTVTLLVSQGPKPIVVPNVVGMPADQARTTLTQARFGVVAAEEYSDTVDKGEVIRQNPVGGQEALPGAKTTIIASKGPNTVVVPDVRGLKVEEATSKLVAMGLATDVVRYGPARRVKRTDPDGGTTVRRGTTITLFL